MMSDPNASILSAAISTFRILSRPRRKSRRSNRRRSARFPRPIIFRAGRLFKAKSRQGWASAATSPPDGAQCAIQHQGDARRDRAFYGACG